MIEIALHTPSALFFDELLRQKDLLEAEIGENIVLKHIEDNVFAIRCGDVEISRLSMPVRMGGLLDTIMNNLSGETARWRQMEDIDLGIYQLSPRDMCLKSNQDGHLITLTEKERDMIMCLYYQEGHSIKKANLLSNVWGYGENIETHTLETHIYRLRQKVERDPSQPVWLVTTEEGYKLNVS